MREDWPGWEAEACQQAVQLSDGNVQRGRPGRDNATGYNDIFKQPALGVSLPKPKSSVTNATIKTNLFVLNMFRNFCSRELRLGRKWTQATRST